MKKKQKNVSITIPTATTVISTSESGKSMVEMLGVLALMGLLAVLGAKGYSMAMERATANRIVEEINRRSIVYSQQLLMTTSNTALNHSELATEIEGGYPVSGNRFGDDYFQIVVQKLPQNICTRIGKLGYARAIQVLANGTALTTADQSACQATGNVLIFTFTKDMTPCDECLNNTKSCETDSQCATNQTCQNGMCLCSPYYACNGTCCPAGQFCVNGQCSANDSCQSTDDCDQGLCISGKCQCRSYRDNCTYFCEMSNENYGICSTGAYYEEGAFSMAGTIWSTKAMKWGAALDFCASHEKQMVSLSDLGCVADGDTYTCTIPEKFKGHGNVWTSDPKDNARVSIWVVNTSTGAVGSGGWNGYQHFFLALCH